VITSTRLTRLLWVTPYTLSATFTSSGRNVVVMNWVPAASACLLIISAGGKNQSRRCTNDDIKIHQKKQLYAKHSRILDFFLLECSLVLLDSSLATSSILLGSSDSPSTLTFVPQTPSPHKALLLLPMLGSPITQSNRYQVHQILLWSSNIPARRWKVTAQGWVTYEFIIAFAQGPLY
jgi:hypothetical protein